MGERVHGELLTLHSDLRRLHLARDVTGFLALLDDDYQEVRDGLIVQPTRAELAQRFGRYFEAVEFLAWDDLTAPRIEAAADGTLATLTIRQLVRVRERTDGEPRIRRTVFSWLARCVRRPAGWRIAEVASTRAPDGVATSLLAMRRALGGERLAALANVRATYSCRGPIGGYRIEMELPEAQPWRVAWLFPARAPAEYELAGPEGWSRAADGTRTPLTARELAMVRSHAFPRVVLAPESLLPALEHRGTRVEAGRTFERLAAGAGGAGALELDLATDLPARLELVDASTDPATVVTVRFESWRAVDGVHVPERVVAVDARGEWVMELASLELTWRGGAAAGG